MTVTTFNPQNVNPVSFTEKAIKHLSAQVESKEAAGIQFNVKESGCSGFKYLLELAFEVSPTDLCFHLNDSLKLYISPEALPLIQGTQVDYVQEGVNFRLDFNNPNATALCGCGESFAVEKQ
ncbi:iron-sulfur cluster assembly accessory protein [Aliikangiella sp. G2MR2-5]|uniref:HesB/IscA family protein n=1 Tax=Aliikangiella sp. G2MR2-5 TaxID=2788943 RepID=UPI0018AB5728|nr:iron-sulfur cluster assembly accessory protein [Aliikangiella sp. G2MR2-5]